MHAKNPSVDNYTRPTNKTNKQKQVAQLPASSAVCASADGTFAAPTYTAAAYTWLIQPTAATYSSRAKNGYSTKGQYNDT
jgi:hypothetical protein